MAAADHLLASSSWSRCDHLAVYLPFDGEFDPGVIVERARENHKNLYLPVLHGQSLRFAAWDVDTPLAKNRFGIPEPLGPGRDVAELDMLLLPLVGWSSTGVRLGMGGGFYDRCLASLGSACPLKVGLGYECQQEPALTQLQEPWDAMLDALLSEEKLHYF